MHVAKFGPAPAANVQEVGMKVPELFVVNFTIPVGLVGLVEVSITLAVQVVATLIRTEPGEQETVVFVGWAVGGMTGVTVRLNIVE